MRAILVHPGPAFSVADVHSGLVKGLTRHGVSVLDFNLNDRLNFYTAACVKVDGEYRQAMPYAEACKVAAKGLEVACYEWWPDVVIVTTGMFVPHDMYAVMRDRGHHLVLWCTESPYQDDDQIAQARLVDTVIVNDPTNLDKFKAENPRSYYIPQSYDPEIHNPDGPHRRKKGKGQYDFGFVGTGYQSRLDFFEKVDWTGLDAILAGHWRNLDYTSPLRPLLADEPDQCIANPDAAQLYRSCKISANLYRREAQNAALAEGWAMGPRELELAACRTFFLREARGEGDDLLWMLPTFDEPGEFRELIDWWLPRDDQRTHLAEQARAAVVGRTFDNHAAQLLHLISS